MYIYTHSQNLFSLSLFFFLSPHAVHLGSRHPLSLAATSRKAQARPLAHVVMKRSARSAYTCSASACPISKGEDSLFVMAGKQKM